jgi:hypothetical protein
VVVSVNTKPVKTRTAQAGESASAH